MCCRNFRATAYELKRMHQQFLPRVLNVHLKTLAKNLKVFYGFGGQIVEGWILQPRLESTSIFSTIIAHIKEALYGEV